MSILREVKESLDRGAEVETDLADALKEAERLADLFKEVKPQPYVVPIERFAGLPVFDRKDALKD